VPEDSAKNSRKDLIHDYGVDSFGDDGLSLSEEEKEESEEGEKVMASAV
jgi:hypothetical protein